MINDADLDPKGNRLITATEPSIEPVTLEELKMFARIDSSYEDALLTGFITAARDQCEQYTGRSFIEKDITMIMDWIQTRIDLPKLPIISITSLKCYYLDGTNDTIDPSLYEIQQGNYEAALVFLEDIIPCVSDKPSGGYVLIYKAGYGDSAADVPQLIKEAIKVTAMELYEGRSAANDIPDKAKTLLQKYWIPTI